MNKLIKQVAQQSYRKVPYHNWEHAQTVRDSALKIFDVLIEKSPNILKSELEKIDAKDMEEGKELLEIAALYHDAGHLYMTTEDDEEKSANLVSMVLKKLEYPEVKIKYVKNLILATIFKNRGQIKSIMGKILADADIAKSISYDIDFFAKDNIRLLIETLPQDKLLTRTIILDYMEGKKNFIGYLTSITGDENQPFLLEETNKAFPHFIKVREEYFRKFEKDKDYFINIAKDEWKKIYGNNLMLLDNF